MIRFLSSTSFYFLMPIYIALALLFLYFNLPSDFYFGIFAFFLTLSLPVFFCFLFIPTRIKIEEGYAYIKKNPRYRHVILMLCFLIILCGPLDLYINGFKLLDPASYADFNGIIGRYVRNITTMCWILIPVAFLLIKNPLVKLLFIFYAVLFPILIIDRNRIFHSCFSLFLCLILAYHLPEKKKAKGLNKIWLYIVPIVVLLIFAVIGKLRSGNAFIIASSETSLVESAYPLSDAFSHLPAFLQQIILYITSPLFNFATVASYDFINQDFLLKQLSPFGREHFPIYPYAPVFIPRFNVGTEFYPFLLYGGFPMVVAAVIFLLLFFKLVIFLFNKKPNIFTLLIFMRMAYTVLFMGFGPQFYILLNLMFIVLMGFLFFLGKFLEDFLNCKKNFASEILKVKESYEK